LFIAFAEMHISKPVKSFGLDSKRWWLY